MIALALALMLAAAPAALPAVAEREQAAIWVPGADEADAGRAAALAGQGRYGEAAAIYERLVAPRHHTLAIRPQWHAALGRAYLAMGLHRAAQGQLRLALSAPDRDDETAMEASAALDSSVGTVGAFATVPDTAAPGGARYVDLRTLRTGNLVRYRQGFAEQDAAKGWTEGLWEVDCATLKRRPVDAAAFDARGKRVVRDRGGAWIAPLNALDRNVAAMLCAPRPPLGDARKFDMKALGAEYRAALGRR